MKNLLFLISQLIQNYVNYSVKMLLATIFFRMLKSVFLNFAVKITKLCKIFEQMLCIFFDKVELK